MPIMLSFSQDGTRLSRFIKDGKLMKYLYDDVKTTYDAFQRGMKISGTSIYWTVVISKSLVRHL